jgi:hypothetical protein
MMIRERAGALYYICYNGVQKSLPKPSRLEDALELIETTLEKLTEVRLALSGVKQSDDFE